MDFPQGRVSMLDVAPDGVLSTLGPESLPGAMNMAIHGSSGAGAVWPVANLAIYVPVLVPEPVTVFQLVTEVTTQAGNLDLGIYDENLNRLVSKGTTAVAAAGIQALDVADTALSPALYYFAMACDSATAAFRRLSLSLPSLRACGVAQQGTAIPLPATATFAVNAQAYVPAIAAMLTSRTP